MATKRKSTKHQLSDAENAAVQAELAVLVGELGSKRAVGLALSFPLGSAQQTISAALARRAGREVAEALYRYRKVTREKFLRSKGVTLPSAELVTVSDRVQEALVRVARVLGFTNDEVELAASLVRGLHGTGNMSDETARELLDRARSNLRDVRRMFPSTVVEDTGGSALDDLGGGAGARPRSTRTRR